MQDSIKPKRALTPALLHGLLVSSSVRADDAPVDLSAGTTVVFWNGRRRADVSQAATKAAFMLLGDTWPCAIAVDELCSRALEQAGPFLEETPVGDAQRALMGELFKAVTHGMVDLHTQMPSCINRPSDAPRASGLAVMQAQSGALVVNARHQMITLEPFGAEVLKLANGVRTTDDLLEELMARVARGEIELEVDGQPVATPDAARAMVTRRLANTLASLARSAVLVG